MLIRPVRVAAALLVTTGLVAGCGAAPASDSDQVRAVANEFAAAAVGGDYAKACSLMTGEAQAQLSSTSVVVGGGDCPTTLRGLMGLSVIRGPLEHYSITSVRVDGDT